MSEVITIGLDIAKHIFQVHGVDACGKAIVRRRLRRSEVLDFFKPWSRAWSALRLARQLITGRGNFWRSAMMFV